MAPNQGFSSDDRWFLANMVSTSFISREAEIRYLLKMASFLLVFFLRSGLPATLLCPSDAKCSVLGEEPQPSPPQHPRPFVLRHVLSLRGRPRESGAELLSAGTGCTLPPSSHVPCSRERTFPWLTVTQTGAKSSHSCFVPVLWSSADLCVLPAVCLEIANILKFLVI